MEKVSVIIPIYNKEKFVAAAIESVIAQTYQNWELILINDGSTDRSKEIAKSYESSKIRLVNLKQGGAAKARNKGIMLARGRYICFLDADDIWLPDKLEKQVKFMRNKKCVFSFTGYEFADENGKANGKIVHVPEKINYNQALKNTTISTCAVMFDMMKLSKSDILMVETESEDTATWWKILRERVKFAYGLDEPLFWYRRAGHTLSANKVSAIRRTWHLYRSTENLNFCKSCFYFINYAFNAVKRRV